AGREDAARDAVQEAFLRYFLQRTYGRLIEHPRAWLYRVVRNHLLDRMTAAAAKYEVGSEQAADLPDGRHGPGEGVRCAQMVWELKSMLSAREMECLVLRADGLSYEEIAGVLGIRPGTVSSLLTRVHKKLRSAATTSPDARSITIQALSHLLGEGVAYSS